MPILDAALAFAITMLLVATVVTQIVYVVQRFSSLRSDVFAEMLEAFYDKELKGVVTREMNRLSKEVGDGVTVGIEAAARELKIEDLLPPGEELRKTTNLSTEELLEVLKRSEFGARALTQLGDRAEEVFAALGERYEVVGERFTESFRRHSRRWTIAIALLLAISFNIDSLFIGGIFLGNEDARQAVISQGDVVLNGYESLAKELRDGDRTIVTVGDLEKVVEEARAEVATLESRGFPVGWSYFPYAGFFGLDDESGRDRNNRAGWLNWAFGVLLTVFFAGLGAPFWYDTVTGIARVVQRESSR